MQKWVVICLIATAITTLVACSGKQNFDAAAHDGPSGKISEYVVAPHSLVWGITVGPDGKLWFTESGADKVGKISTAGVLTEYRAPGQSQPEGIVTGPDGNLWIAEFARNKIAKMTTAGKVTEYNAPLSYSNGLPFGGPTYITTGSDGNLWFTEINVYAGKICKITASGRATAYSVQNVVGITRGPDSNIWFTVGLPPTWGQLGAAKIGRITTNGSITEFNLPTPNRGYSRLKPDEPYSDAEEFALGSDGNLWFTGNDRNEVAKISSGGVVVKYRLPTTNAWPSGIVRGPDGNIWFTESVGNKIGKITMTGQVTEYKVPTPKSFPYDITLGPDGNLWFTEQGAGKIGKIIP